MMIDVKRILSELYQIVKNLEIKISASNELSDYFRETLNNLDTADEAVYRVPADIWLSTIKNILENLNLENLSETERYRIIRDEFYIEGHFLSLHDVNKSNIPIAFGMQMQSLYYNPDLLVGVHGTTMKPNDIENEIFNNGLLCNHGPNLTGTVALADSITLPFYRFVRYMYKPNSTEQAVIVCVPKEKMGTKIWRKDQQNKYYLSPQYIYGYYTSHNGLQFNEELYVVLNQKYNEVLDLNYVEEDKTFIK